MTTTATEDQDEKECPLCMEQLDLDELNFFPCKCLYQICQFCWNRIKQEENGLCPVCRQPYPDQPVDFKPFSAEELKKIQKERRKREQQRKQKMSENRKHLANMRVVQKNLVLVHGMPPRLCDPETLKKSEYFGQFGKIQKIAFGTNNPPVNATTSNASMSQSASASVYVTYSKEEEAVKAIMALNQRVIDGKILRASLGTTKYCSCFLQNKPCQKTDCMYLHEVADSEASFTKEDMATKRHEDYERKVCEEILLRITSNNSILQQRGDVFPSTSNELSNFGQKTSRDSSVTPQSLTTVVAEQQPTAIANPSPASPISQSNAEYSRNYRTNIAPRHHKKLDAPIKVTSTSPIDIPSEQQLNSTDRSLSAQQNITVKPILSSSATNLHLSGSVANLNNTVTGGPGSASQSLSTTTPSEQSNLSQRHSVAGQPNASPNFDVGLFLRQQTSTCNFANSNGGQNQSYYNQTPAQASKASSSFFSHDDDSSYFYKQRLKPGNDEKPAIVEEPLALGGTGTVAVPTTNSSSLLDFILGTNSNNTNNLANKNTGQSEQFNQQNLANGLSLPSGSSSILGRFSKDLSNCFPVANEILKTNSKPQDDWQTSPAFNKSDDDLGFDPIFESSKALEDLLREEKEKEEKLKQLAASQRLHSFQHQTQIGLSNPSFLQLSHNQTQLGSSSKANVSHKMPPHQVHQTTSNLWPMSSPLHQLQQQPIQHGLHGLFGNNGASAGVPSGSFFHDSHSHNTNLMQSAMFRFSNPGTSSDFPQCAPKVLNTVLPGAFNGLNAQAAPFIPRQVNHGVHHHAAASSATSTNQSVKDMQEQFRSFFPEASVKFQQLASTMSATVPPSLPPPLPSSVGVLTSANMRSTTGWSGPRTVDPRQSLFSRPPPPLVPPHSAAVQQSNMPPQLSYPAGMRPTTVTSAAVMKLTSQATDLQSSGVVAPPSAFHHGHARLGGMSSTAGSSVGAPFGAPPTLGQNFNTEYPNWSLTPTPPPGFAPSSHQSPS